MGRALVRDPTLFLFDEPLSNLDAKLRVEMRTEIKKLHQTLGKTTVYVTHDQVEAMTLASRIAVMHQGALQQFDEPRTVYDRPANMFVAGFMGSPAMNFLPAEIVAADAAARRSPSQNGGDKPLRPAARKRHGAAVRRRAARRPRHPAGAPLPLRSRPCRAEAASIGHLDAPVEVVEPTGAETIVIVRVGEREIVAPLRAGRRAARWARRVTLGVDMGKACLFDPDTRTPDLTRQSSAAFSTASAHLSQSRRPCRPDHRRRVRHRRRHGARPSPGKDASVAFVDIDARGRRSARVERLGGSAAHRPLFIRCDLTDIAALRGGDGDGPSASSARSRVLVNNAANDERHDVDRRDAGLLGPGPSHVNLRHQFFAAQAVRPHMRELGFGSIINFSSIAWMFGAAEMSSPMPPPRPASSA